VREVHVRDCVIFVDAVAKQHNALVTAVWSPTCVNVVLVNDDDKMTDSYGRQISRNTSVLHKSSVGATFGKYWMFQDEEPNPIQEPLER